MPGGSAANNVQGADDIVAQVLAASDNLQDLGLEDMQEPIDDDEEYVDEVTGKKKQRSWLGKLGKGISKRANGLAKVITGGTMTQADQDALAVVMACRHPYAVKEGGIGVQDPEDARICRCVPLQAGPCIQLGYANVAKESWSESVSVGERIRAMHSAVAAGHLVVN